MAKAGVKAPVVTQPCQLEASVQIPGQLTTPCRRRVAQRSANHEDQKLVEEQLENGRRNGPSAETPLQRLSSGVRSV